MLVGDIPTSFGLHPLVSLPLGILLLYLLLRFAGRPVEADVAVEARAGVAPG
jgi:hypothetical protein